MVPGDHGEGATPDPISNSEVKPFSADDTARVTLWESRTLPGTLIIRGPKAPVIKPRQLKRQAGFLILSDVPLSVLLQTFGRYDLLDNCGAKKIRIAKWNLERMEIDSNTLLPPGEHFLFP